MGVTCRYHQVDIKYFDDFKKLILGTDIDEYIKYSDWMWSNNRELVSMEYLSIRENAYSVRDPLKNSLYLNEEDRRILSHDFVFGEVKSPLVQMTGNSYGYLTKGRLKRHLSVIDEANLADFRKYATAFLECYKISEKRSTVKYCTDFIDKYLQDENINWGGKLEEVRERERNQLEELRLENLERKRKYREQVGNNKEESQVEKNRKQRSGIDALFAPRTKLIKKPDRKLELSKILTQEEQRQGRINFMINQLEESYSIFCRLIDFCKITVVKENVWLHIEAS